VINQNCETRVTLWVPRTVSPPLISESLPADLAVPAGAGPRRSSRPGGRIEGGRPDAPGRAGGASPNDSYLVRRTGRGPIRPADPRAPARGRRRRPGPRGSERFRVLVPVVDPSPVSSGCHSHTPRSAVSPRPSSAGSASWLYRERHPRPRAGLVTARTELIPAHQGREVEAGGGAEDGPVAPRRPWAWVVSSEHGDLVPEHQDLDVLGCVGPREQRQPAQHVGECQVCESKSHGNRSCWAAGEL